jgi:hypothetical protein
MPLENEGENRLVVHIAHYPEGKIHPDQRQLVNVQVWPADKPTLAEKLAYQRFLESLKVLRSASRAYPG